MPFRDRRPERRVEPPTCRPRRAPPAEYLAIPGLLQTYYLRFGSGEYGGVYVWDSAASMERFMASELARSICDVYRVEESVRDIADVVLALRGRDAPAVSG